MGRLSPSFIRGSFGPFTMIVPYRSISVRLTAILADSPLSSILVWSTMTTSTLATLASAVPTAPLSLIVGTQALILNSTADGAYSIVINRLAPDVASISLRGGTDLPGQRLSLSPVATLGVGFTFIAGQLVCGTLSLPYEIDLLDLTIIFSLNVSLWLAQPNNTYVLLNTVMSNTPIVPLSLQVGLTMFKVYSDADGEYTFGVRRGEMALTDISIESAFTSHDPLSLGTIINAYELPSPAFNLGVIYAYTLNISNRITTLSLTATFTGALDIVAQSTVIGAPLLITALSSGSPIILPTLPLLPDYLTITFVSALDGNVTLIVNKAKPILIDLLTIESSLSLPSLDGTIVNWENSLVPGVVQPFAPTLIWSYSTSVGPAINSVNTTFDCPTAIAGELTLMWNGASVTNVACNRPIELVLIPAPSVNVLVVRIDNDGAYLFTLTALATFTYDKMQIHYMNHNRVHQLILHQQVNHLVQL